MNWKIYYGDGTTFSDQDGTPFIAPARDVQVIVMNDKNHAWRTQAGNDYYVWDDRGDGARWWGVDQFGMYDYLIDPGYKRVLFGRTVTSNQFDNIFRLASNDPDFPKKTAFANRERKP